MAPDKHQKAEIPTKEEEENHSENENEDVEEEQEQEEPQEDEEEQGDDAEVEPEEEQAPEDHNPKDDDNSNASNAEGTSSPGKIFIGGLAKTTSTAVFTKHFSKYGEITDSVIMRDKVTGHPRGFGFVTYADPTVIDKVIKDVHVLDGKTVEIKRTIPRTSSTKGPKTKKIFVGGIPTTITEDEFKDFFSKYGKVVEHQIMHDRSTGRSRGFGFVTFDSEKAVDDIVSQGRMLELGGKQVEIKKAEPKKPLPPNAGPMYDRPPYVLGGHGGFRDDYGGYGGPSYGGVPYNAAGYGGRVGGYAGSSAYGASDYGRGYGGYGGGYEDVNRGYGGRPGPYGDGFGPYGMASYGGRGDGYGGYSDSGYGSAYESRMGAPYGAGGSYTGGRGSYGSNGNGGRYHPYAR